MIDATAPGRLRSVCSFAVVAGLLFSLFVLCCCMDVDSQALGAGDTLAVASAQALHDDVADAVGHVDPDCGPASTVHARVPAFVHSVAVVAVPVVRAAVETAPGAGPSQGALLRPPVAHLLCVMRT